MGNHDNTDNFAQTHDIVTLTDSDSLVILNLNKYKIKKNRTCISNSILVTTNSVTVTFYTHSTHR